MPWCVKKCPYCDFNSHQKEDALPEQDYIQALIEDFKRDLDVFGCREIMSVFIGGGTPSLFSGKSYQSLLSQLRDLVPFTPSAEITLEANPGTIDQVCFEGYLNAGINRLSLGIQTFQRALLKKIGRIHDEIEAINAFNLARTIGFENINIDIMYGLPEQSLDQALQDLNRVIELDPEHLSWYQFTLEPNTYFHKHPPTLPPEDELIDIEEQGLLLFQQHQFERYEISAFSKPNKQSVHNLNYWMFGDYFGIGAGAHGKFTQKEIVRTRKHRQPNDYLDPTKPYLVEQKTVSAKDLIFEWMLNTSRLEHPIPYALFKERTDLPLESLLPLLKSAAQQGFVQLSSEHWQITPLGRRYTNDFQMLFLEN